jgi:hypothetical protein
VLLWELLGDARSSKRLRYRGGERGEVAGARGSPVAPGGRLGEPGILELAEPVLDRPDWNLELLRDRLAPGLAGG